MGGGKAGVLPQVPTRSISVYSRSVRSDNAGSESSTLQAFKQAAKDYKAKLQDVLDSNLATTHNDREQINLLTAIQSLRQAYSDAVESLTDTDTKENSQTILGINKELSPMEGQILDIVRRNWKPLGSSRVNNLIDNLYKSSPKLPSGTEKPPAAESPTVETPAAKEQPVIEVPVVEEPTSQQPQGEIEIAPKTGGAELAEPVISNLSLPVLTPAKLTNFKEVRDFQEAIEKYFKLIQKGKPEEVLREGLGIEDKRKQLEAIINNKEIDETTRIELTEYLNFAMSKSDLYTKESNFNQALERFLTKSKKLSESNLSYEQNLVELFVPVLLAKDNLNKAITSLENSYLLQKREGHVEGKEDITKITKPIAQEVIKCLDEFQGVEQQARQKIESNRLKESVSKNTDNLISLSEKVEEIDTFLASAFDPEKDESFVNSIKEGIEGTATIVNEELDKAYNRMGRLETELGTTKSKVASLETELGKRITMPIAGGFAVLASLVGAGLSYLGLKPALDKAVSDAIAKTKEDELKKKKVMV